jgi:dihydrodipicolinate synthase/N-acetylneuraminate lyase
MGIKTIPEQLVSDVRRGGVIPAMPLALNNRRRFDEQHQRALVRYYIDAGACGLAVGVHSTQFKIRDPGIGLHAPVLSLVAETIDNWCTLRGRAILKIAGVCGRTQQASKEAEFARDIGYHACLLSLDAYAKDDVETIVRHCRELAGIIPLVGFYLQPAVGGRILPYTFWREFAEIENVLAIKIAPFNRYQTFDVVRAICDVGREQDIALYTGNDDNIVVDLLSEYAIETPSGARSARIVGGLLSHWAVWTKRAVELLEEIHAIVEPGAAIPPEMLSRALQITDCNAAFFDAANQFAGCIPGIHEVLRRQGLLSGTWCLDPHEALSPGQKEEIDRVYRAYPTLNDDAFVSENLASWLA